MRETTYQAQQRTLARALRVLRDDIRYHERRREDGAYLWAITTAERVGLLHSLIDGLHAAMLANARIIARDHGVPDYYLPPHAYWRPYKRLGGAQAEIRQSPIAECAR